MSSTYRATVRTVVRVSVRNGPYATAHAKGVTGSITFSLRSSVWKEEVPPTPGCIVILDNLIQQRAGWRALSARLFQPEDEQGQEPKQPKKSARN